MARSSLLAAAAALLLVSTVPVAAQVPRDNAARESEERALRDRLADRDEYRARLILELQRRLTLLAKQQQNLELQEKRLQFFYEKVQKPIGEDDEEEPIPQPQPASTGRGQQRQQKPETLAARRAKDLEIQTYRTHVARVAAATTRREITELRALLARNP